MTDEEFAAEYIRLEDGREDDTPEPWPVEEMRTIVARDPGRAWRLITAIVRQAPRALVVRVGVRELEEFLTSYAREYLPLIEREAADNDAFVLALANVWITHGTLPPDVERRLVASSRGMLTVLKDS